VGVKGVDQIIKNAGAIRVDDVVARLTDGKLLRVVSVTQEYDYGTLHAEWLTTVEFKTGVGSGNVCASRVTYPLNEMEVLAWAASGSK